MYAPNYSCVLTLLYQHAIIYIVDELRLTFVVLFFTVYTIIYTTFIYKLQGSFKGE